LETELIIIHRSIRSRDYIAPRGFESDPSRRQSAASFAIRRRITPDPVKLGYSRRVRHHSDGDPVRNLLKIDDSRRHSTDQDLCGEND
jgi:hypothetical protein